GEDGRRPHRADPATHVPLGPRPRKGRPDPHGDALDRRVPPHHALRSLTSHSVPRPRHRPRCRGLVTSDGPPARRAPVPGTTKGAGPPSCGEPTPFGAVRLSRP